MNFWIPPDSAPPSTKRVSCQCINMAVEVSTKRKLLKAGILGQAVQSCTPDIHERLPA